jgi:hypothetical protein
MSANSRLTSAAAGLQAIGRECRDLVRGYARHPSSGEYRL